MASVLKLCAEDSAVVRFAPRQAIPERILCDSCLANEAQAILISKKKPARKAAPKKKAVAKKR